MLGFSYGEIFLLLGVTAAVIGPKDLPIIARTAGRLAGRAVGYVQLARGQFDSVMQQTQARQKTTTTTTSLISLCGVGYMDQRMSLCPVVDYVWIKLVLLNIIWKNIISEVHKELQDTMAQLDAIRHEIRSISIINPGPMTRRLVDNLDQTSASNDNRKPEDVGGSSSIPSIPTVTKDSTSMASNLCNMQSQATTYARLAESAAIKNGSTATSTEAEKIKDELQLAVLPVSAESTGLVPNRGADVKGSDIVLEAILEADVAHNAKEFFSQPQNQISQNQNQNQK